MGSIIALQNHGNRDKMKKKTKKQKKKRERICSLLCPKLELTSVKSLLLEYTEKERERESLAANFFFLFFFFF